MLKKSSLFKENAHNKCESDMILVTGGAGVVGSRLVKKLSESGHKVRVLTLPNDPALENLRGIDCEIFEGDVTARQTLKGACNSVDTVFHLAAVIITMFRENYTSINLNGTINMIDCAIADGVEHFVLVSSAAASDPGSSAYAQSKKAAEDSLLGQQKMYTTIVRPTLVYERGGGQEFMLFWNALKKYPVVPFIGKGEAMKNPVYVDDLIAGLAAIAGNERTFGKIYNLTGDQPLTMLQLTRLLLRHQGKKKPIICLPLFLCRFMSSLLGLIMKNPPLTSYGISRIEADAAPDNSAARTDLGYSPISMKEGLQKCYPLPSPHDL